MGEYKNMELKDRIVPIAPKKQHIFPLRMHERIQSLTMPSPYVILSAPIRYQETSPRDPAVINSLIH